MPPRRRILVALVPLALLIAAGVWLLSRDKSPAQDLEAAIAANERGVGRMAAFDYAGAAAAFADAERLAPGWRPATLNRGIALYNLGGSSDDVRAKDSDLTIALGLFDTLLNRDPNDIAAHYNIGVIRLNLNDIAEAAAHLKVVTELDPNDGFAWLLRYRALPDGSESPEGRRFLELALAANPYLNAARYSLAQHALTPFDERGKILAEFNELAASQGDVEYNLTYSDMGKYALVVSVAPPTPLAFGPLPLFTPGATVPLPAAASAVRDRFGATVIRFDFDRDGKPDALVLDSEGGDRLLKNRGDGFDDITKAAGLTGSSLGAAAADYDNDGFIDLILTRPDGVRLLRNDAGKRFADVTQEAGLATVTGFILTAAWADLDLDGDLDLLLAKFAPNAKSAEAALNGDAAAGGVELFANVGVAKPGGRGARLEPLSTKFAASPTLPDLAGGVTGFLLSDVDRDLDPDIVVFRDGQVPATVLNDRLLRFRVGPSLGAPAGRYNGGLVLDFNGDEQSDYVLVPADQPPILLASRRDDRAPAESLAERFAPTPLNLPALKQAQAVDLDRDGRSDLVGLAADGEAVAAQNEGNERFAPRSEPFGPAGNGPWLALGVADLDGDGRGDLLGRSDAGLTVLRGGDNGNHALLVRLSGLRDRREPGGARVVRANADGIGTRARASTADTRSSVEFLTLSAGLGQSLGPVELGVGPARSAEVLRLRWPDALVQAELDQPADTLLNVSEISRKPTSCPVLSVWDGTKFVYVTDFLGAGALGETGPDGSIRPPRPEESVAIPPGLVQLRGGKYALKIAEPMDEVLYFDAAELSVVDHPKGVTVLPDERFTTHGPPASQRTLAFADAERIFPIRATDHRGRDLTQTLRANDGRTADDFAVRSWLGYAEEHAVTLDFGERLRALPANRPVYLVLAGWTDYPFPESIAASAQAGVPTVAPILEQRQANGEWKHLAEVGFPAGLPRVMTRDVTGLIDFAGGPLRIRTNLRIYWDQISICPVSTANVREVRLPVAAARLAHRGFIQEVTTTPGGPIGYDAGRVEPVAVTEWAGSLTKLGDVTELVAGRDDRLCVSGPGDELELEFDARQLPALEAGWARALILRANGYSKDTAPTTVTGGSVGPLPFRAMPSYPYGAGVVAPHAGDAAKWRTRPAGGR